MHLETQNYRMKYVNIDLRHQYVVSVAKAQTSFLRARRDVCIRRVCSTRLQGTVQTLLQYCLHESVETFSQFQHWNGFSKGA